MSRVLQILFNTEMVQAILDGRKTVTRRKIDIDIINSCDVDTDGTLLDYQNEYGDLINPVRLCRYQVGDILYARETWSFLPCIECMDEGAGCRKTPVAYEDRDSVLEGCFVYRAGHPRAGKVSWSPSRHMPKAAARIWLKVTDVRVERLQEIDGEGCVAEGVNPKALKEIGEEFAKGRFQDIWDSTISKPDRYRYGWDADPWVWVIEFERCEKLEEI